MLHLSDTDHILCTPSSHVSDTYHFVPYPSSHVVTPFFLGSTQCCTPSSRVYHIYPVAVYPVISSLSVILTPTQHPSSLAICTDVTRLFSLPRQLFCPNLHPCSIPFYRTSFSQTPQQLVHPVITRPSDSSIPQAVTVHRSVSLAPQYCRPISHVCYNNPALVFCPTCSLLFDAYTVSVTFAQWPRQDRRRGFVVTLKWLACVAST